MNGVRLRCFHGNFWWIIGFVWLCIFIFFHWRKIAFTTHRAEMNVPEVVWNDRILFSSRPHVRKNLHMYIIAIVMILNSQSIKLIIKRQIQTGWHKHNAYNKIEWSVFIMKCSNPFDSISCTIYCFLFILLLAIC